MLPQPSLFPLTPKLPEGLGYRPDFLTAADERALIEPIAALSLTPFAFHGFEGRRRTASFGWRYGFDGSGLTRAGEIPDFLLPLRARAAAEVGLAAERLEQALVIEYAPGAVIGWHRDRSVFGQVVGISLLSPAPLRFRRRSGTGWERATLTAEPRSIYTLEGEARAEWEHSIPALDALRYSITFRTLR